MDLSKSDFEIGHVSCSIEAEEGLSTAVGDIST